MSKHNLSWNGRLAGTEDRSYVHRQHFRLRSFAVLYCRQPDFRYVLGLWRCKTPCTRQHNPPLLFVTCSHQLLVRGKFNYSPIWNCLEPCNHFSTYDYMYVTDLTRQCLPLFSETIRFHLFAGKLHTLTKTQRCEVAKFSAAEVGNFDSKFAIWLSNSPRNWLLRKLVPNFPTNLAKRRGKVMWN